MVAPIDYTLNVKSPFESLVQGFEFGAKVQDRQAAQAAAQQEQASQAQMIADIQAAMGDPMKLAELGVKYPKLSEPTKRAWDILTSEQKKSALDFGWSVNAALSSGNTERAKEALAERAAAMRNAKDEQQAKAYEDASRMIDVNPQLAIDTINLQLSQIDDKFAENYGKMKQLPSIVRKGEAEATIAEVEAENAPQAALLDLEKKGWDIKRLQQQIVTDKQNAKIYALNAALQRESNALKREELGLKIAAEKKAQAQAVRDAAAEASNTLAGIDMMADTVDRVLDSHALSAALGTLESRMPTLSEDTADVEALIENLSSQAFLTQVSQMKGTGALSDAEGKKISAALQSLDLKQSEAQFRKNLSVIKETLANARERTRGKFGMPKENVSADVELDDIDALINKYAPPGE